MKNPWLKGFDDVRTNKVSNFHFTSKNVFSTKNNPICGIDLWAWCQIIYKYGHCIDMIYYPRVVFITILACVNSVLAIVEWLLFSQRIENVILPPNPVFIIGHPRTGTTLVHNLLASDANHFYYCSTFCAGVSCYVLVCSYIGGVVV